MVAGFSAAPGSKMRHSIELLELPDGTKIHLLVVVVNRAADGPRLHLSARIHCDEENGVQSVSRVLAQVNPNGKQMVDAAACRNLPGTFRPIWSKCEDEPARILLLAAPPGAGPDASGSARARPSGTPTHQPRARRRGTGSPRACRPRRCHRIASSRLSVLRLPTGDCPILRGQAALPEEQCTCRACGARLVKIGEETSEHELRVHMAGRAGIRRL
jgi:hypothetical protein